MSKKIDLSSKLDFSPIDLTAPDTVVEEYLSQLPEQTQGIILGKIESYDGPIQSYTRKGLASSLSFEIATGDKHIDIQEDLGASGLTTNKFECYIYTPVYDHYKYRMFFMQYGIANYPMKLVLEESIAKSISSTDSEAYIYKCDTREELEAMIEAIFSCKRVITIMQEIIRIYQAKKDEKDSLSDHAKTEPEEE